MPRPRKYRNVCALPTVTCFYPKGREECQCVLLEVEEYEVIRLIDWEGLTQEECAEQMEVARTTVQRIYNDARRKLADVLVQGKALRIEGGNYKLCQEEKKHLHCGGCERKRNGHGNRRKE